MQSSNTFFTTTVISGFVLLGSIPYGETAWAQEDPERIVEEVIVTAQKRNQTLAEIPMSVSVLSGDLLDRQQIDNFKDFITTVPGFSFEGSQPGFSRITLRGINAGGGASTVGVYYGDVPFGSSSSLANGAALAGDFDTFDLARIEVLRGPQGTLYGASAVGGVMRYIPNAASTEAFEARVRGALESTDNADLGYSLSGVVNVPLSDTVAIRATAYTRTDEGFIDSIGNNPIPSLTDPANNIFDGTRVEDGINTLDTHGARVSALFQASDNFSLELLAMIQNIESGAPDNIDADPVSLEPLFAGRVQSRYHPSPNEVEYEVYSGVIDWDFGATNLQSVTSYATLDRQVDVDAAWATFFTGGPPFSSLVTLLFSDPAVQPLSVFSPQINKTDKFTQEFRLLSPDNDRFEWLLGLFYNDEESLINQDIYAVNAPGETRTEGIPTLAAAILDSQYEETAVFGNATWFLSDRWELSLGARWSENDQSALQSQDGVLIGGPATLPLAESSDSPFTWSIAPRYQFNDNASLYARVATGYRPGGPNILPPGAPPDVPRQFDSDELTTYEVGYKMNSPDGDFSLDVAAYFLDWEDIQVLTTVNQFTINANGGTAESKGFELAAGFHPLDGLSLSLNAAYTKAKLTEDILTGGRNGDPLPYVPEWTFGASGDYEWVTSGGSTAYVGGNVGYVDDRPTDVGADARTAESYTTVSLRAGMIFDQWSVEVYAKNLTDDEGYTNISGDGAYPNALGLALIRPRTFGLALATRF